MRATTRPNVIKEENTVLAEVEQFNGLSQPDQQKDR